jgi:signal transduction histidine kinase
MRSIPSLCIDHKLESFVTGADVLLLEPRFSNAVLREASLPTLGDALREGHALIPGSTTRSSASGGDRSSAIAAWKAAVAALNEQLRQIQRHQTETESLGVILAGPTPIISDLACIQPFAHWMLVPQAKLDQQTCLPGDLTDRIRLSDQFGTLSLCDDDPLAAEQFCLVLTRRFCVVMVLDPRESSDAFQYSFDPIVVERAWHTLRSRIVLREANHLDTIDQAVTPFPPIEPHYSIVMTFGQSLLAHLQRHTETVTRRADRAAPRSPRMTRPTANLNLRALSASHGCTSPSASPAADTRESRSETPTPNRETHLDLELLSALTHEVRTPLTTIQTLVKILLRRKTLADDLRPWVEQIERECSDQIERFDLIFRAVEFETAQSDQSRVMLTKTPLKAAIDHCIPRWQKQASRRNLTLEIVMPQKMPQVVSDPSLLERILTSTIEHFTSQLPVGSNVRVEMLPAGNQLKLQLKSSAALDRASHTNAAFVSSPLKAIGQLLTFQPETGSISLNLAVTKNIFQALGGKLTVRSRPQDGDVVTIFLPLE